MILYLNDLEMTFLNDPLMKKWKIFLRRQWLVFHCVSLRSLFYHCHAFRFLFWVLEFSRISRKSSTLPDFYWFCCRPINASRVQIWIRTSHSITSIRHWLVTWWITLFSFIVLPRIRRLGSSKQDINSGDQTAKNQGKRLYRSIEVQWKLIQV